MRKKRIAFLINSLVGGGAERVMCSLLAHSRAECEEFDVSLVLLDEEEQAYEAPDWTPVHRLDCRGSLWRSMIAVRSWMTARRPDLTLSFLTRANVANVLGSGGPSVISARIHTSAHVAAKARRTAASLAVRATYPRAAKVIAVSDDVAQDLRANFGVGGDKLVTIPNPVDVGAIRRQAGEPAPLQIEGPYVLGVGRLAKVKNFALLIRAVAQSGLPHKLVILGEGKERAGLQRLAAEHAFADRLVMPGRVDNPFALMRGADMFAMSSNGEGFPNALVEAMALGAPVIATDCASGPSEILADAPRGRVQAATVARYGILTPPDNLQEFIAALRLAAQPDMRARLSPAAVERGAHFDPIAIKDRYWAVLRAAMAPGQAAAHVA